MDKTKSQIMDTTLPKLYQKLRLYRFNSAEWGPDNMKAETYSFPMIYTMEGWLTGSKWVRTTIF